MARQVSKTFKRTLTPRQEMAMLLFRRYNVMTVTAFRDFAKRIELHAPDTGTLTSLVKREFVRAESITYPHRVITFWRLTDKGMQYGTAQGVAD